MLKRNDGLNSWFLQLIWTHRINIWITSFPPLHMLFSMFYLSYAQFESNSLVKLWHNRNLGDLYHPKLQYVDIMILVKIYVCMVFVWSYAHWILLSKDITLKRMERLFCPKRTTKNIQSLAGSTARCPDIHCSESVEMHLKLSGSVFILYNINKPNFLF